jgi:hypothetical protein
LRSRKDRFARLGLEALEDCLTPSQFVFDFSKAINAGGNLPIAGKFNIILTATDGAEYTKSFAVGENEGGNTVRDRIVNTLTVVNWDAVTSGDYKFLVMGHQGASGLATCSTGAAYIVGYKEAFQVKVSASKVMMDGSTNSLTFADIDPNNPGLTMDCTFDIWIGSNEIQVSLSNGETASQVTDDVFTALSNAGYSVTESDGVISLTSTDNITFGWEGGTGGSGTGGVYGQLQVS